MIKTRKQEPILPLTWWVFFDYATGGYEKTDYNPIYIEARTEKEAITAFEEELGTWPDPNNFSLSNEKTIEDASAHWVKAAEMGLQEYLELPKVLVLKVMRENRMPHRWGHILYWNY